MNKIVIAGGTGFIGKHISKRFNDIGYDVKIISRSAKHVNWHEAEIIEALENAELVLNLSGKSINCRHTPDNRTEIYNSRLTATTLIGNSIKKCNNPPKLWINASASGIYNSNTKSALSEDDSEFGTDYIAKLVKDWEKTFIDFELESTRQIALRTSVVLGKAGGALKPLIKLTKIGLGGKQSDGKQIFSWIHIEDYFRIILYLIHKHDLKGTINCTSPEPVTNKKLMSELRKSLKVPFGIPAPAWIIKIGAAIIGTESSLILKSTNIYPKRLNDSGFKFQYPELKIALNDIISN